jgi:hypothetical protein
MEGMYTLLARELSALEAEILELSPDPWAPSLSSSEERDLLKALTPVRTALVGALVAAQLARDITFRISVDRLLASNAEKTTEF